MAILVFRVTSYAVLFAFFLVGMQPYIALAENSNKPRTISVRLTKQQKKIQRLQKGIQGHKSKLLRSHEKEKGILSDLESIDSTLRQERQKLQNLQTALDTQEVTIHELQGELSTLNAGKQRLAEHLQNRLAAFYRMGSIGYMNVVFSTSSLPDLLNFQEYFRLLLRQDQMLIDKYRQKINELSKAQDNLNTEKKEMLAVIVDIKDQEVELKNSKDKRTKLLNKVKTEKKLYQRALTEMEKAADNLDQAMVQLKSPPEKKKIVAKKRTPIAKKRRPVQGFAARKGRLKPPIQGLVTRFFGKNTNKKFDISTESKGIDIRPSHNKRKIRAIYSGRVIYAGALRGYGQMMIIDHGHQYYSLTSRITELKKTKGQLVHGGEVIGIIEDESGLLGDGLHFEIRQGTEPQNPLHWLDNRMLRIRR